MGVVKMMDLKAFVDLGFLQEANRQFFHPLGLALQVGFHDDGTITLDGLWDYREDQEGITFGDTMLITETARQKEAWVATEKEKHRTTREAMFGSVIQLIPPRTGEKDGDRADAQDPNDA